MRPIDRQAMSLVVLTLVIDQVSKQLLLNYLFKNQYDPQQALALLAVGDGEKVGPDGNGAGDAGLGVLAGGVAHGQRAINDGAARPLSSLSSLQRVSESAVIKAAKTPNDLARLPSRTARK